jgi:NADH:ubiquinone oxidoreductase subunit 4 (subunit M)
MPWPPAFPILSALLWTPALGAVAALFPRGASFALRRKLAMGFAGLTLALAILVAALPEGGREIHRFLPALGFSYELGLDRFGSIAVVWIALLAFLAIALGESGESDRSRMSLVLAAETCLLGLVTAADSVLFLQFYGAGTLALALLVDESARKRLFFFQSLGVALAFVYVAATYHMAWTQTGFPSAEIARISSLVVFPEERERLFLLGSSVLIFAAPLFPFVSSLESAISASQIPSRLMLAGGWILAAALFFTRVVPNVPTASNGMLPVLLLAGLSPLYSGLFQSRRSEAHGSFLVAGAPGIVALGLLSSSRAGMLPMAVVGSMLAFWKADPESGRSGKLARLVPVGTFLVTAWVVLEPLGGGAPVVVGLAAIGSLVLAIRLLRSLPPLTGKRTVLLLGLLAFWAFTLFHPSPLVSPMDTEPPVSAEEE